MTITFLNRRTWYNLIKLCENLFSMPCCRLYKFINKVFSLLFRFTAKAKTIENSILTMSSKSNKFTNLRFSLFVLNCVPELCQIIIFIMASFSTFLYLFKRLHTKIYRECNLIAKVLWYLVV